MTNTIGKFIALSVFGFSSLFLLMPELALASNDGWANLNWNQTRQEASGMGYLNNWLTGVQQRWSSNGCNKCKDNRDSKHTKSESNRSNDGRNNVSVKQSQEVVGHYQSVSMEQTVKVYVNGQLTSSDQQLLVDHSGNWAGQNQDVSVRGY